MDFTVQFDSTQTIYEREYFCSIGENEFQHTNNRSLKIGQSGSVSFSGRTILMIYIKILIYDEYPYDLNRF